ncbi:glycosyltransferase family 2 protein [Weissella diestrammenae]|uniref:Glycosyltransferase family 2 protein n=1 Tax=Weissella diestrammenae TaxID=1162633 RepID=A0A7G9T6F2_9LACO|nr:glycosyltransferase family 2 protein [Weissella diestrammenae]MCM0583276.1 glycosyltransferase family 2 protein [Weissella diestrammenae]QNN75677.1 glycosyltransferase family 2 protein [Weissella diestrammenae]
MESELSCATNKQTVSVIMPIYNQGEKCRIALESFARQTMPNFELLIIDNHSTDDSMVIVDEFANSFSNMQVITCEEQGVSHARNKGLAHACGDLIIFADPDDAVADNLIEKMLADMSENVQMVISGIVQLDFLSNRLIEKSGLKKSGQYSRNDMVRFIMKQPLLFGVTTKCFRRDVIDDFNVTFDQEMFLGEDLLFVMTYLTHIETVYFEANYLVDYYRHVQSATHCQKELLIFDAKRRRQGFLLWHRMIDLLTLMDPVALRTAKARLVIEKIQLLKYMKLTKHSSFQAYRQLYRQEIINAVIPVLIHRDVSLKYWLRYHIGLAAWVLMTYRTSNSKKPGE